jgi:hypothetical protein
VHWPLYAFATNAFLGKIPTTVALLLIPVSFVLGYFQYRYVEQRFQFASRDNNSRYLRYITAASLAVSSLVLLMPLRAADKIVFAFRDNPGLNLVCDYTGDFDNKPQCRLPGDPRVALWGDSFAMMWAAGLADALHGEGLIQITKSECGPFEQLAAIGGRFTGERAATCIQFNTSALQYIVKTDSIKAVVLSSAFDYYMGGFNYLVGDKVEKPDIKTLRTQFLGTISVLGAARKNVILIAPVPRTIGGVNIGACLERKAQRIFFFPTLRNDCSFAYDNYGTAHRPVIEFLQTLERLSHVNVIWPESVTCNHETCVAQIGETPLYRDGPGHITYDASVLLTRMLHIADKLGLPSASEAAGPNSVLESMNLSADHTTR